MSTTDKKILRELAKEYIEIAKSDDNKEKIKVWTALHNFNPIRGICLFETETIIGFIEENELKCVDKNLRHIEKDLRHKIKHKHLVDDDMVFNDYFDVYHTLKSTSMGIDLHFNINHETGAVVSDQPIQTPDDLKKIKKREFSVDKEDTEKRFETINDIFGDIMDVRLNGIPVGLPALTKKLVDYMGMENIYYWTMDYEEELKYIMNFLKEEHLALMQFVEKENLVAFNNDAHIVGSGSYGYINCITNKIEETKTLKDTWGWIESQETETISPEMFGEFFLPYMAELASNYGCTYYGCCEHLHDRWNLITSQIHNIKSVSISPWSDVAKMGEYLDGKYIFSRKPPATLISGNNKDYNGLREDVASVKKYAKNNTFEIIYRDVYDVQKDLSRITEFGKTCKEVIFS